MCEQPLHLLRAAFEYPRCTFCLLHRVFTLIAGLCQTAVDRACCATPLTDFALILILFQALLECGSSAWRPSRRSSWRLSLQTHDVI